jgi:hypothetical protein
VDKLSELVLSELTQVIKSLDDLLLWKSWVNELHLLQLLNDGDGEGLLDQSHGDLSFALLRLSEHLLALFVVGNNALHHTNGLWKWAIVVIV